MDYYYTIHELVIVVAKSFFLLLADESFPADGGNLKPLLIVIV